MDRGPKLTLEQLAERTGRSYQEAYYWCRKGGLPFIQRRPRGCIYVLWGDYIAWRDEARQVADDDEEQRAA